MRPPRTANRKPQKNGGKGSGGVFRKRPVRRGQLISPFGVGAITDFRNDEALMCAGLDAWFRAAPEHAVRISEERLQSRLRCDFFVTPPEFNETDGGSKLRIPYVRFPLWHYCPRCFRMKRATLFSQQPHCDDAACSAGKRRRSMIPVRIVSVCEHGHIEDFPFRRWINCQCPDDLTSGMFFKAGRSAASLNGIKIECHACGQRGSLAGAFNDGSLGERNIQCSGAQPWLGRERGSVTCPGTLQAIQRGASNAYFPLQASSIYIPPSRAEAGPAITAILDDPKIWPMVSAALIDGKPSKPICDAVAAARQVDPHELYDAVLGKLGGGASVLGAIATDEDFRRQEHDILSNGGGSIDAELFVERIAGTAFGTYGRFIKSVGLVRKLRETRVLSGFSRLSPKSDFNDPDVQKLSVDDMRWLPAIDVRGEGIFLELRDDLIAEWTLREVVRQRSSGLIAEYGARRVAGGLPARQIDSRFMMVHTLAHAIMKELTFTCGYGSASLRERLYCNLDNHTRPMNGLLIYTASGDSEGTLGGLVSQAEPGRFERIVDDALRRSTWCSNDPVCMESPGQGSLTSNLAACHGCVLAPETSCEEGNRLLDRGFLIGTVDTPSVGFFTERLNEIMG
jgi:hypothetical protein